MLAQKENLYYNKDGIVFGNNIQKECETMEDMMNTQFFQFPQEDGEDVTAIIASVYDALREKGYNPISQIVGYIMSGDPTYITSYHNARSLIMKVERDELLEEFVKAYISTNLENNTEDICE